jgi:hypothetical protein
VWTVVSSDGCSPSTRSLGDSADTASNVRRSVDSVRAASGTARQTERAPGASGVGSSPVQSRHLQADVTPTEAASVDEDRYRSSASQLTNRRSQAGQRSPSGGTRRSERIEGQPSRVARRAGRATTRTSHRRAIDVGDAGARTRQARRTETAVRNTALWVSAVTTTRPVRAETLPAVTATRRRGFVDLVSWYVHERARTETTGQSTVTVSMRDISPPV